MAAIVYAHRLQDAKMRQWYAIARAGATEDVTTVSAVVLAVRKCEGVPTSHADVGVGPLGRLQVTMLAAAHA